MTIHDTDRSALPISADSHVVEGPDVFAGLRLMWGSDYPHTDSTWPCSTDVLDEMFADYPESARRAITRDTVKQLYNM